MQSKTILLEKKGLKFVFRNEPYNILLQFLKSETVANGTIKFKEPFWHGKFIQCPIYFSHLQKLNTENYKYLEIYELT
jgi:hypothetical protein